MAARFFCDNCGTEARRNTVRCPRCGRYFAFVRCPQCDFTGEESLFAKGCPQCGYCTTEPPDNAGQKKSSKSFGRIPRPPLIRAGKLPLWVYIVAALVLAVVALVLYVTIR
jgi:uncharacterized membrane protein YvbJ